MHIGTIMSLYFITFENIYESVLNASAMVIPYLFVNHLNKKGSSYFSYTNHMYRFPFFFTWIPIREIVEIYYMKKKKKMYFQFPTDLYNNTYWPKTQYFYVCLPLFPHAIFYWFQVWLQTIGNIHTIPTNHI